MAGKNTYEKVVKPRFKEIEQLCLNGAEDKQIYEALGIGKTTYYKYLKNHNELQVLVKENRDKAVNNNIASNLEALANAMPENEIVELANERMRDKATPTADFINLWKELHPYRNWFRMLKWYEAETKRMQAEKEAVQINNTIGIGNDIIEMVESVTDLESYNQNESK